MIPDERIGVVVITRNRLAEAMRCVDRLASTEASQVVVVDNGSTDGTAARLRSRHGDVDVIRLPCNAGAAGRNLGVARCAVPYVAFCDDDSAWEPGALTRAADLLDAAPDAGLLAARVMLDTGEEDPLCRVLAASPLGIGRIGPRVLGFAACAAVVRRQAFLHAGGFRPLLGVGGEETVLALDLAELGWTLEYAPEVVAHHAPSPRRDRRERSARVVRNALLTAWLRRRTPAAWSATGRALCVACRQRSALRGLADALGALPAVRRERAAIPPDLERDMRRLEEQQRHWQRTPPRHRA